MKNEILKFDELSYSKIVTVWNNLRPTLEKVRDCFTKLGIGKFTKASLLLIVNHQSDKIEEKYFETQGKQIEKMKSQYSTLVDMIVSIDKETPALIEFKNQTLALLTQINKIQNSPANDKITEFLDFEQYCSLNDDSQFNYNFDAIRARLTIQLDSEKSILFRDLLEAHKKSYMELREFIDKNKKAAGHVYINADDNIPGVFTEKADGSYDYDVDYFTIMDLSD